ncbi:MAG TPA: hypothetical protein VFG10_07300 [Saprospiraceae bacterium]|nr:hypothetical protein [Saprospiraceae bacterium]
MADVDNKDNRSFLKRLNDNYKPKAGWIWGGLIAILLISFGGAIELFTQNGINGFLHGDRKDKYIAVVITQKSDATFTIPEEFRRGFGNEISFKTTYTTQNISFEKVDDFLSVEQAKIIANNLINDENCVLIIGNSTSQLTEVTLNEILSSQKIKPGFILPIATADNIIDKAKDQKYKAILRMMPNNDQQAKTIKNFIFKKFKIPKVMILCDEENITYSYNLSQKIADNIILSNGKIVLKKNYGNTNTFMGDFEYLRKYNLLPDIIVFVGISSNGSLLNEQLNGMKIDIPIIYTDGCTVNNLMEKSKNNPNHFFISAVKKANDEEEAPTYQPVGEDARDLAKLIIQRIKGNITRESVSSFIYKNRDEIILNDGKAGNYSFDENGDNINMKWKVYSYLNGKLTMVYGEN